MNEQILVHQERYKNGLFLTYTMKDVVEIVRWSNFYIFGSENGNIDFFDLESKEYVYQIKNPHEQSK